MPGFDALGFEGDNPEERIDLFWQYLFLLQLLLLVAAIWFRPDKRAIEAAKNYNRLELDDESAKVLAGFIQAYMHTVHTNRDTLSLPSDKGVILAAGPHKTGAVDAFSLTANMEGKPPRFFATNTFFQTPVVGGLIEWFMRKFKVIVVDFGKETEGKVNARQAVLDAGNKALRDKERVAVFPQGNFAYIGQEAPIIYNGTAKMAIENDLPIHIVLLRGFSSLENRWLPVFVKNNSLFRALGTLFLSNQVETKLCWVCKSHLEEGVRFLPEEEKIRRLNAEMYAFFRHTEEITDEQIEHIKSEIQTDLHLRVWDNKFGQNLLKKKLAKLKNEFKDLEEEMERMPLIEEMDEDGVFHEVLPLETSSSMNKT